MRALGYAFAFAIAVAHTCLSMPGGGDAGPASDAGTEPDGAAASRDAGVELCVSGTSACAFAPGARWIDGVCCVAGATQCVTGTADRCGDALDESWTGSVCCIRAPAWCASGTALDCGDSRAETWTGSVCCVREASQCVSSTPEACRSAGGAWTGSVCCG